jgi:membrane associated rhomboid family serine protease
MAPLFAHLTAEQARTYALVLASAGIDHAVRDAPTGWAIDVPIENLRQAVAAIRAYRRENPAVGPPPVFPMGGLRPHSAVFAALLLMITHAAVSAGQASETFVAAYGADAQQIVGGQIYRCITALLLHRDWAHLAANMAGTLLFGTYVAAMYGWGVGWLLTLFSGAAGNLLTAVWHGHGHRSIGASTAVFAAVGLCAAHSLWRRTLQSRSGWRAWAPLAGGLALVGWLGTAPQSDLLAHLLGFACGLAGGLLYMSTLKRILPWPIQAAALVALAACIIGAWYGGMAYRA